MIHKSAPRRFELRVERDRDASLRLALDERRPRRDERGERIVRVSRLGGDALRAVMEQVHASLRRASYSPSKLDRDPGEPVPIPEEEAVRLGLLFLTVQPMRKAERIHSIARAVYAMGGEELFYWFGKSSAPREGGRARRALRVLLSEE